jgi:hypothetical protein
VIESSVRASSPSMTSPTLDILGVPTDDGLVMLAVLCAFSYQEERIRDFVQAIEEVDRFNAAHGTNVRIARDEVITQAMRSGLLSGMRLMRYSPIDVRGILAHEAPDTPLGEHVVWRRDGAPDVVMPTGRWRGQTNVALWLPDPCGADIRRKADRIVFDVPDDRLIAVPTFRAVTGLYRMDPGTRLPVGEPLPPDTDISRDELRWLQANTSEACVSALVHGSIGDDPPIGVANGIPWSVTAFVEITPMEALKFRPRDLSAIETGMDDLVQA